MRQVAGFHQNQAALPAERLVLAEMGTANPASPGVASVLVRKDALYDEYLFTTVMAMRVEKCSGCPAHHRGVMGAKL